MADEPTVIEVVAMDDHEHTQRAVDVLRSHLPVLEGRFGGGLEVRFEVRRCDGYVEIMATPTVYAVAIISEQDMLVPSRALVTAVEAARELKSAFRTPRELRL